LDPAGVPSSEVVLNDRTPKLINDLDIRITDGVTTYYPWKLDPENPAAAATQGDNIVDNVEQVYLQNPVAGQKYTITVSHKGTLVNNSQNYALVITGIDSDNMGTQETAVKNEITLYPNPVAEELNIKLDTSLNNALVRIFNPM